MQISIHALREEGDVSGALVEAGLAKFLSTPSARRATHNAKTVGGLVYISIHALREEGDFHGRTHSSGHQISIHALREEGDLRGVPDYAAQR